MRVNANAPRCRPSLGVNIMVAEGSIGPRPTGTYHQRLEVVIAGKADRDRATVLVVVVHLVTRHRAAGNEGDESLGRQGTGIPVAAVARLPFLGASMPNKRTRCRPNFTVSPSETAKPCDIPVPLVSEFVWANAGITPVQSAMSTKRIFTCSSRYA